MKPHALSQMPQSPLRQLVTPGILQIHLLKKPSFPARCTSCSCHPGIPLAPTLLLIRCCLWTPSWAALLFCWSASSSGLGEKDSWEAYFEALAWNLESLILDPFWSFCTPRSLGVHWKCLVPGVTGCETVCIQCLWLWDMLNFCFESSPPVPASFSWNYVRVGTPGLVSSHYLFPASFHLFLLVSFSVRISQPYLVNFLYNFLLLILFLFFGSCFCPLKIPFFSHIAVASWSPLWEF